MKRSWNRTGYDHVPLTKHSLTGQQESSGTKEMIATLLERLDRLDLGTNGGDDAVGKQDSTRTEALLTLVISAPSWFNPPLNDFQRTGTDRNQAQRAI